MAKLHFKGVIGQRGVYSLNVPTPCPVLKPRPGFQDAKHPAAMLILGVVLMSVPSSPRSHLLLVFISAMGLQHDNLSCADSAACGSMWWIRSSNWSGIKKRKRNKKRVGEESYFALDQFHFKMLTREEKCPWKPESSWTQHRGRSEYFWVRESLLLMLTVSYHSTKPKPFWNNSIFMF